MKFYQIFRGFWGFLTGQKGGTIPSYTYGTWCVQPRYKSTFTDINGVRAPSCTSQEFQFKVFFYYRDKDKNAKIENIFGKFGKKGFDSKIPMVDYKFHYFALFI